MRAQSDPGVQTLALGAVGSVPSSQDSWPADSRHLVPTPGKRTEYLHVAIGVGLPDDFTTYLNLAPTVEWLRGSARFVFYWVSEEGSVREE